MKLYELNNSLKKNLKKLTRIPKNTKYILVEEPTLYRFKINFYDKEESCIKSRYINYKKYKALEKILKNVKTSNL